MPFRTPPLDSLPELAYAHAELFFCHHLHASVTLHSCHDGYGPTASGGTYADMVHSCFANLHNQVAASFSCAGWKGVGKTKKGSGKADSHVMEQVAGRFGRWRRIADAASKQSLRCVHHGCRQFSAGHIGSLRATW